MTSSLASSLAERAFLALAKSRDLDRFAMKAVLKASELLGLALGHRLRALRDSKDPLQAAFAEGQENLLLAHFYLELSDILASRWDKLPDKRRPQYTPEQRYRILSLKKLFVWSAEETAKRLRVSAETIARWERDAESRNVPSSDRPLVRPNPPVRRYADVVRQRLFGFGGYERIAQTLARVGFRISARTVGRILREKPPRGIPSEASSPRQKRAVRASYPNHIFLVDLTEIPGLFGLFRFKLALVLDLFSRFPLSARVFPKEPTSTELSELLRQTSARFGVPKHLVSDQGSQFTASDFQDALQALGVRHRLGAIGKVGSIAVLERFWRTLKDLLRLRAFRPLVQQELERRVELGLRYYAFLRPHQGLEGATPAEVYFGWKPAHPQRCPPSPRTTRRWSPRTTLRSRVPRPANAASLSRQSRLTRPPRPHLGPSSDRLPRLLFDNLIRQ